MVLPTKIFQEYELVIYESPKVFYSKSVFFGRVVVKQRAFPLDVSHCNVECFSATSVLAHGSVLC